MPQLPLFPEQATPSPRLAELYASDFLHMPVTPTPPAPQPGDPPPARSYRQALARWFTLPLDLRRQLFAKAVETARPQWTPEERSRFCSYYTAPMHYDQQRMCFEVKEFSLATKLATWTHYAPFSSRDYARSHQAEAQRQRDIRAEEERQRRQQQRDADYQRRTAEFVPLPILEAYRDAGYGDPFAMDKAAIIADLTRRRAAAAAPAATPAAVPAAAPSPAIHRREEAPAAKPIPPILIDWLSRQAAPPPA